MAKHGIECGDIIFSECAIAADVWTDLIYKALIKIASDECHGRRISHGSQKQHDCIMKPDWLYTVIRDHFDIARGFVVDSN